MTLPVMMHKEAVDECLGYQLYPDTMAAALRDCIARGLARTSGSKFKALRKTPGRAEMRLRFDHVRAVVSLLPNRTRPETAFIHLVDTRNDVYRHPAFAARLNHFAPERDEDQGGWKDPAGRYEPLGSDGEPAGDGSASAELELLPTANQYRYVRALNPLFGKGRQGDPFLVIGRGPPGSGKTLVAWECIREAVTDGFSVMALVPSQGLLRSYRNELAELAIDVRDPGAPPENPSVLLADVREMFGSSTAEECAQVRSARWKWRELCRGDIGFQQRLGISAKRQPREFAHALDVVDALYGDEAWLGWFRGAGSDQEDLGYTVNNRDEVDAGNRELYGLVAGWGARSPATKALEALLRQGGYRTRAQRACDTGDETLDSNMPSHPLLVLVDECQDLVPAEWRVLLKWASHRDARTVDGSPAWVTRVALLGDLNQRVNVTPFSWEPVTTFAHKSCGVAKARIANELVERETFRCSRTVAETASALMDARLSEKGAARASETVDPANLPSGGVARVAISAMHGDEVVRVADRVVREGEEGALTLVTCDSVDRPQGLSERLDVREIAEAKGLEFDRVVVVNALGRELRRGGDRLSFDRITALYTAVTRARSDVLLCLRHDEWKALAPIRSRWDAAGCKVLDLDTQGEHALEEALRGSLGLPSDEEQAAALQSDLSRLADGPVDGIDAWLDSLERCVRRVLSREALFPLLVECMATAANIPDAWPYLEQRVGQSTSVRQRAECLLLIGEVALARRELCAEPNAHEWLGPALERLQSGDALQAWMDAADDVAQSASEWTHVRVGTAWNSAAVSMVTSAARRVAILEVRE